MGARRRWTVLDKGAVVLLPMALVALGVALWVSHGVWTGVALLWVAACAALTLRAFSPPPSQHRPRHLLPW